MNRIAKWVWLLPASLAMCAALPAQSQNQQISSIAAQPLSQALQVFSRQTGLQLIYVSDDVRGCQSQGVPAGLSPKATLARLLQGTKLHYEFLNERTVRVFAAGDEPGAVKTSGNAGEISSNYSVEHAAIVRLAEVQADGEQARNLTSAMPPAPELTLQEVVVTAQKREERLQDVPVSISVLNTEDLAANGQNRLVDYFASVPGLSLSSNSNFGGTNYVTIRGLSTGNLFTSPIVATVVDDVPTTSSNVRGFGAITTPDLDPSDLARIEVLKGPQGTLYGADSLGGLIKYVTIDPSTDRLSGRVEVGGEDITEGGLGYAVRGAVNIPVSNNFALRISGFDRRDPGYIDDLTTGANNFNSVDVYGSHIAALWRPWNDFSLKLSALIQEAQGGIENFDSDISGRSTVGGLGLHTFPGTTSYTTRDEIYSATLQWKVGGLDVTSVTGYVINMVKNAGDYTAFYGAPSCQYFSGTCVPPGPAGQGAGPYQSNVDTHKFSEELRIGSSIGRWLDWRLGGFFTHENSPSVYSNIYGGNPTTGVIAGTLYATNDFNQNFHEYAAFGDLTIHVTDRFDVALGGRESWSKQQDQYRDTGALVNLFDSVPLPATEYVSAFFQAGGHAFTYQANLKYKVSQDLMTYARVASGYRIGGYNVNAFNPLFQGYGIPKSFAPDKTTNYELGLKGDVLGHVLSFNASVYYIDWNNFQLGLRKTFFGPGGESVLTNYTANAGSAKSEGVELSLEGHPTRGLTIAAEGSYDNAVLTEDLPAGSTAYGVTGDRLPYSMRLSGGLSVNQDVPVSGNWVGFVGGSLNYVGSRPYQFNTAVNQPRIFFPAYTQFNLRTGARYDSLLINLYVNNVADRRGIVSIQPAYSLGNVGGYNATIIQPRTIGFSLSKAF